CKLTNCSRGIRNAWHFYYALNLVIKVVCGGIVLRCSPLSRALALKFLVRLRSFQCQQFNQLCR
ncbi:DUF3265 domain-containing protein, partial [Vibrio parahaemolyticus]|nr:DUF3265 domain-containing protein [Vibrio parahaemolyticus]